MKPTRKTFRGIRGGHWGNGRFFVICHRPSHVDSAGSWVLFRSTGFRTLLEHRRPRKDVNRGPST